jgi:hypothetical protein
MKKTIIAVVAIVIVASLFYYFRFLNKSEVIDIIKVDNKSDLIVVVSPINNSEVSSPLVISGRARGTWFFEGSFPVELLDSYRNTIAQGHVTAQGEWMTEDFVKFIGSLQFNNYIKGQKGILVLKKDNPSGLVEYDDSVEVPVVFK